MNHWLHDQLAVEKNPRRREILQKEIGHGTKEFLRTIWYPAVGNFNHLYAEWEVRDYGNRCRYLDLTYMPGGAKGCIEIHGYRSHARDIESWRFRDLCKKQSYLVLDDWLFLPVAYLSIEEEPEIIKQMVLSFIGKFVSMSTNHSLSWIETETLRFARSVIRPFRSDELALHLNRSTRHTRRILDRLVEMSVLMVHNEQQRYRTYQVVNHDR
ncbi:transcriptional regulator [Paenibacillus paeoniae]|uniref:Transcriptional regulator n=1 Tax=Paenibacillus paeoniae TaxID=2292705 RepID=A0A371PPV5_9BACL|nr:transcriptional regulator [Paenibacillus paeoniae]REK77759.1 transcriptional regulator [Paenibacillus paeoniae]